MLGIAAPQLPTYLRVGVAPEARQVLGDLDRTAARGEQMHYDGHPALGDPRGLRLAEELLAAGGREILSLVGIELS